MNGFKLTYLVYFNSADLFVESRRILKMCMNKSGEINNDNP